MYCNISTLKQIEELYTYANHHSIGNDLNCVMDVLHLSTFIFADRLLSLDKDNTNPYIQYHIYIIYNCLCELRESKRHQIHRKHVYNKIKRRTIISRHSMSPLTFYKQFTYEELEEVGFVFSI
jgi:hypothetical protein